MGLFDSANGFARELPGFEFDLAVVGGCGHVGLPLGLAFCQAGLRVLLFDIDQEVMEAIGRGNVPFTEAGIKEALASGLASGKLFLSSDRRQVAKAEAVIVVVGTPIDEHLSPNPDAVIQVVDELGPVLLDGQLMVLRSTIYPGVTKVIERHLSRIGKRVDVAFCPERIVEGQALVELRSLPQIVSGCTPEARVRAAKLFLKIAPEVVELEVEEAELAKLFTNSWRYLKFAIANQLFMMANDAGLDYEKIREALAHNYPRAKDLPGAGFSAGPCLLKDTMHLAAFSNNNFVLGHTSMMINEGMPHYLVERLSHKFPLETMTVGILGMAFKAESDDTRQSLAYRLKRLLQFRAAKILCTDPYVTSDSTLLGLDQVVAEADLLIIAAPHQIYGALVTTKPVVDITNLRGEGVLV